MMMMDVDEIFHDGGKSKWVFRRKQHRIKNFGSDDHFMTKQNWLKAMKVTIVTQGNGLTVLICTIISLH